MKKLALLLLCTLIGAVLFAEDIELGYRAGNVSNFTIYPEGNFYMYPSQLGTLEQDILQLRPELSFTNLDTDVTTDLATGATLTDRSPGTGGGDPLVRLGLAGLYATRLDDLAVAIDVDTAYRSRTIVDTVDSGYTTPGETVTTIDRDVSFGLGLSAYASLPVSDFTVGVTGGYSTSIDPVAEEFQRVTDTAVNNGEEYITTATVFASSGFFSFLGASVSGTLNSSEWAARALGSFRATDYQDYYSIDTDTDGFDETVVDQNTWGTTPAPQGGGGNAFYDFSEELSDVQVLLSGFYKMPMSSDTALIFRAGWTPVSTLRELTHERFAETEQNEETRVVDSGLLNGELSVAYDFMIGSMINVRAGSGVTFAVTRTSQEELDNAGDSVYDVNNTERYNEVNYGADPDNDQVTTDGTVANVVTVTGGRPSSTLIVRMPIDVEARISPSRNVTLFSGFDGGLLYAVDTYNVFNTADNTVWTEEETSLDFDVTSTLFTGVEFGLGDNLTVIMSTDITNPFQVNADSSTDRLPSSGGTDTTSTAVDTVDTSDADFNFDITVTLRY